MAELKVEVCKIEKVEHHPNADRLDIVTVKGWNCIVGRGAYTPDSLCVYIPIDSILPEDLEAKIFEGAKVKLSNHRVRTIKLRGVISQGLVVSLNTIEEYEISNKGNLWLPTIYTVGMDMTKRLGITKWEPPAEPVSFQGNKTARRHQHPDFIKYTNINHLKNYPNAIEPGENVVVTEKIHGTNFRCGWLPTKPRTLWAKLLKFLKLTPEYEFVYGSHNIQLQDGSKKQFYTENVYSQIINKYDLKAKLRGMPNKIFFGEIFGPGIQKGYAYGRVDIEVVFFDIYDVKDGRYLDYYDFKADCRQLGLNKTPVRQIGPWHPDYVSFLENMPSLLGDQKYHEGFVVRTLTETNRHCGRVVLKHINPEYLLRKDNTEWH